MGTEMGKLGGGMSSGVYYRHARWGVGQRREPRVSQADENVSEVY